jgi:hypothetical protein
MTTVKEYVDNQSQPHIAAVIGRHGANADLPTHMNDYLVAAFHAVEAVLRNYPEDYPDPRAGVVAEVEMALKHWGTESYAVATEPDEDSDVLGGYPMPYAQVEVQLEQG